MATGALLSPDELVFFLDMLIENKDRLAPGSPGRFAAFKRMTNSLNRKRPQTRKLSQGQVKQQCVLFLMRKGISKSKKASDRYEAFAELGMDFIKPPLGTAREDSSENIESPTLPTTRQLRSTKTNNSVHAELMYSLQNDANINADNPATPSIELPGLSGTSTSFQVARTAPFLDDNNIDARLSTLHQKISAQAIAYTERYRRHGDSAAVVELLRIQAGLTRGVDLCDDLPPKKLSKALMSYAVYNTVLRDKRPLVDKAPYLENAGDPATWRGERCRW